jgi:hypothetical protein
VNNEVLDNIHEEFVTIAFTGAMKIHSFQEARGITGIKGVSEKVCVLYRYKSYATDRSESKADSYRWWTTSPPNSASHKRWRLLKASTRTTCRWLDLAAEMTKAIVLSLVC